MQLVSAMAQGWLDFRLLTIKRATNFNDLDACSRTFENELRILKREQVIDLDEEEYIIRTINDTMNQRSAEFLQQAKR